MVALIAQWQGVASNFLVLAWIFAKRVSPLLRQVILRRYDGLQRKLDRLRREEKMVNQ